MSGTVHFVLTEAKSYKCIEIELYGGALVKWCETQTSGYGQNQTTQLVTFESKETFVEQSKLLWNNGQSPNGKIGPGTFDLPFQFTLPSTCPGSFKGKWGSITYVLRGYIKTGQLLHLDHKVELPFRVKRITDINLPHLIVPTQQSEQTPVGCFCCSAGNLEFTASLTRTGCCVGQNLPLTVSVVNGSSRRIKMRVSIQRHCTYRAQSINYFDSEHEQHTGETLVVVVSPEIAPHSPYTWNVEDLLIPTVEPSFEGSAIIKVQDTLKVTAVIPWDLNSSVMFPITIGNVPFNCDT